MTIAHSGRPFVVDLLPVVDGCAGNSDPEESCSLKLTNERIGEAHFWAC